MMFWARTRRLVVLLLCGAAVCGAVLVTPERESESAGSLFVASRQAGRTTIYLASYSRIAAIDGLTGRQIYSTEAPGGGINVGPVVAGSTLAYMNQPCHCSAYGIDSTTGAYRWRIIDRRSSLVAVSGNAVLLAPEHERRIAAIASATGRQLWQTAQVPGRRDPTKIAIADGKIFTNSSAVFDEGDGRSEQSLSVSPTTLIAVDDRVLLASDDMPLEAMDAATEKAVWTADNPYEGAKDDFDIYLAASTRLVAAAFYKSVYGEYEHSGILRVYDISNGKRLWEKQLNAKRMLPADPLGVDGRRVYLLTGEARGPSEIDALDGLTGANLWSLKTTYTLLGPIVPFGDALLVSGFAPTSSGKITLFSLNMSGSLRWKYSL